jgi:hypothetical protein
MNPQRIYTAWLTADLAAVEGWYTKLLGRGPDHRPMDTLVQWELFDQGGLMLSTSEEIAGYIDDLAAERRRLQGLGIVLGGDIPGDYSTLAQVHDPDSNLITLASPARNRPVGVATKGRVFRFTNKSYIVVTLGGAAYVEEHQCLPRGPFRGLHQEAD